MPLPWQNEGVALRRGVLGKVVFLDRDGVINQDSADYIKRWAEFAFIPGSLEALKLLRINGFTSIIITNQSAVNRNLMPLSTLEEIHRNMKRLIAAHGGSIHDIFFCPHRPDEGCTCRKPQPGLIHSAQRKHRIDLAGSWMVGDSAKDIACARNAGCGHAVLVRTGNGRATEPILAERKLPVDCVAQDLLDAAGWIIAQHR